MPDTFVRTCDLDPEDFSIDTERLSLRLTSKDHLEGLFGQMSDSSLTEFLTWEAHQSMETTLSVINSLESDRKNDSSVSWTCLFEGNVCGLVSLIDIKRWHRLWYINRAELAYWLGQDYQGNGFMTEACRAVLDFTFYVLKFHKVLIAHAGLNTSSEKIIKRLGFRYIGCELEAFLKNEKWHDLYKYELLASSWKQ